MRTLPAVVVYNPALSTIGSLKKQVNELEQRHGLPQSLWIAATYDNGGLPHLLRDIQERASTIVVAGGDGLVRAVAEIIHSTGLPMGIIPMGTGNLLARNLGLPVLDRAKCVVIAITGQPKAIDLAQAELISAENTRKHTFAVMAGIGLDADMAAGATVERKKRFGWIAYVRPIIKSVTRNKQQEMSFILDGKPVVKFDAHTAIVGNCGTLTANLLLIPDAVLDDGLLNIVVLNPKYITGWTHIWSRVAIGGALNVTQAGKRILNLAPEIKTLRYDSLRNLTLQLKEPQVVQLDGDPFGEISELRVTVLPGALSVRVAP